MLDLAEEKARAATMLAYVKDAEPPDDPDQATAYVLTLGILSGIVAALNAIENDTELRYDGLIPESPEGLL